ncbi:MAG TPA: tRNA (adenosine(37)-N6)-threonylcarbamoyltransferase complex dimerization subunit type 1 TsaB [Candidatus Saccharimonadales bacterium]|nr:tRNA (adenosine(37)-N6)-threonylcarbamoyltransferase complex dimerization subunit type 1 TsaB [Candidatus Saccharimonadales bacterium]
MLILTIRTDKSEAELGLFDDDHKQAYLTWLAHRQLAETIHSKIDEILRSQDHSLHNLKGIVAYRGPGSFTGLRIGISTANALAYGLKIPIVATSGNRWLEDGQQALIGGENQQMIVPNYGAPPHITVQKK